MEFGWIVIIAVFAYIGSRFWKDIRLNLRLKKQVKWEINDIINNPKYRVKGKNE